jgi:hypothetical protein
MNIKAIEAIKRATDLLLEHDAADEDTDLMLCIDWQNEVVEFFSQSSSNNSTSAAEWHGHEINVRLPKVDARNIKQALLEFAPSIREMAECYDSQWNGSNHVASWTDLDMLEDFRRDLDNVIDDLIHSVTIDCSPQDWFSTVTAEDLGITAATTDEEVEQLAKENVEDALHNDRVLYGAEDYLLELRDEQID